MQRESAVSLLSQIISEAVLTLKSWSYLLLQTEVAGSEVMLLKDLRSG